MSQPRPTKVLLVVWDGADRKVLNPLLDAGLMPALDGLINDGVIGDLATLEPMLPPIVKASLVTGVRADRHRVLGHVEPDGAAEGVRPTTSTSRRAKAVWDLLSENGKRCHVIGWPHPAESINGVFVSDVFPIAEATIEAEWPLPDGCIAPAEFIDPLQQFRVHPGEMTGAHLLPFVPRAARIDQSSDGRLARVAEILAESSSIHAAATWLMENEPWDFLAIDYSGMESFSREFMPYHPPRHGGVSERDFEDYREVVAGAYRFHDMMLERLLQLAGPETTVVLVSGYGLHSDQLRPRFESSHPIETESSWRRPQGILVIKGPAVRKDEQVFGAGILDIAPMILSLFDVPIPGELPGRPPADAFEEPLTIRVSEAASVERTVAPLDAMPGASATLHQLAARGLIPAADGDVGPGQLAEREQRYNLARSLLDAGQSDEAAVILDELAEDAPGDVRFAVYLAVAHLACGDIAACRRLIDRIDGESTPIAGYLQGLILAAEQDDRAAFETLSQVRQSAPGLPRLHCEIGQLHLRLDQWREAEAAFRTELEINAGDADAWHGLAIACLQQRRPDEAARAARAAIGRRYAFPHAHFQLGIALMQLGRPLQAAEAFETCLTLDNDFAEARRMLDVVTKR